MQPELYGPLHGATRAGPSQLPHGGPTPHLLVLQEHHHPPAQVQPLRVCGGPPPRKYRVFDLPLYPPVIPDW